MDRAYQTPGGVNHAEGAADAQAPPEALRAAWDTLVAKVNAKDLRGPAPRFIVVGPSRGAKNTVYMPPHVATVEQFAVAYVAAKGEARAMLLRALAGDTEPVFGDGDDDDPTPIEYAEERLLDARKYLTLALHRFDEGEFNAALAAAEGAMLARAAR